MLSYKAMLCGLYWGEMESFDALVSEVKPRLARAFVSAYGVERGQEALAEAMSWAAGHPDVGSAS